MMTRDFVNQVQFKGTRPGPVQIDVELNGERVRGCPFMCHQVGGGRRECMCVCMRVCMHACPLMRLQLDISDWGTPEVVECIACVDA